MCAPLRWALLQIDLRSIERRLRCERSRIMYELEVCSDGTTEAQPRSFRQNRPTASTLSDIMQVQHMSQKIRENAETFPYLAKL